jgi:hypothetical protein
MRGVEVAQVALSVARENANCVVKAREALEFSTQSINEIAWQVGYEDHSAFRKVFNALWASHRDSIVSASELLTAHVSISVPT